MKIGIDLGTANVLVYVKGKGIVIQEPSVVAVGDDNRIVAVGEEAREMIGRTPGNIRAIRPMKDGVIADYVITEAMLRYFIAKATGAGRLSFSRPEVMISVPAGVTSVEKRAVRDAALKAGARDAYLIEEPLAAAIGAPLQQLGAPVRMVLEQPPPELSSDIIDKGMVLSGGGALLRDMDRLLTQVTGVPCHVAENPLNCVAVGTGLALEHFDFFRKSLVQAV